MSYLILNLGYMNIHYTLIKKGENTFSRNVRSFRNFSLEKDLRGVLTLILSDIRKNFDTPFEINTVGLVSPFGGDFFSSCEPSDDQTLSRLESLRYLSPLHIPVLMETLRQIPEFFQNAKIWLLFQSGLFTRLPDREKTFAISRKIQQELGIARNGYCGLFHEAAVSDVLSTPDFLSNPRILSICLEPRPEACALAGKKPLMTTSFSSLLGGLCGETSSGEIDPSLPLMISKDLGLGPEEVDSLLQNKSGIRGLLGHRERLGISIQREDAVGSFLRYQYLKILGSAVACLGGLDAVVFSGRYAEQGKILERYFQERFLNLGCFEGEVHYFYFKQNLEEIALEFLQLKNKSQKVAC